MSDSVGRVGNMAPIDINNQEIDSITLNGNTDIDTVEVNGQEVFSSGPSNFPVAYSNLVAWYPFDSAAYGGSNTDDVTAILGGSGDDTAFNLTVNGATYDSSGGAADIQGNPSSGYFEFNGTSPSHVETSTQIMQNNFTISFWARPDSSNGSGHMSSTYYVYSNGNVGHAINVLNNDDVSFNLGDGGNTTGFDLGFVASNVLNINQWNHIVMRGNHSAEIEGFVNGNSVGSDSGGTSFNHGDKLRIGEQIIGDGGRQYDGDIDDYRMYNTELSNSQINQIYQNTDPN